MSSKFYTKKKQIKTTPLDFISSGIKLQMNWSMIKNGVSVNQAFASNPVKLEDFLKPNKKYISANMTKQTEQTDHFLSFI